MTKSIKIYIFILVLFLVAIISLDVNRPKPINWAPSFGINDKIPFGMHIFNEEIEGLFKKQKIEKIGVTPYEFLDKKYNYKDSLYTISGDIMYISNDFVMDDQSVQELLYFVSHGNSVFISTPTFPRKLRDTLHFETTFSNNFKDTLQVNLNNKQSHTFFKGVSDTYFSNFDSLDVSVLGNQINTNKEIQPNFIKIPHVNGAFFLHTQPVAFTNYYLLKDTNYKYVEGLTSYLEKENIFWYLKGNSSFKKIDSPMRYILSQPALKWAWYIALISMLIFMFFNAKRRQRIIPIKEPLKNTTVDFTKTIGNLYFQEGNHQNIIDKKIIFFLEKIRNEYFIDTFDLDEKFINRLHQKTGKNKEELNNIVRLIKKLRNQLNSTDKDLIEFNNALEKLNL